MPGIPLNTLVMKEFGKKWRQYKAVQKRTGNLNTKKLQAGAHLSQQHLKNAQKLNSNRSTAWDFTAHSKYCQRYMTSRVLLLKTGSKTVFLQIVVVTTTFFKKYFEGTQFWQQNACDNTVGSDFASVQLISLNVFRLLYKLSLFISKPMSEIGISFHGHSKALKCKSFWERKNSWSSKFVKLLLLSKVKAR